jgi:hypothetical protein
MIIHTMAVYFLTGKLARTIPGWQHSLSKVNYLQLLKCSIHGFDAVSLKFIIFNLYSYEKS